MKVEVQRYVLNFRFEAGTSRGVMTAKVSYFLKLFDQENPNIVGIGECGPLEGLSLDLRGNLNMAFDAMIDSIAGLKSVEPKHIYEVVPENYPALRFALETANMDLQNGGKRVLYENEFTQANLKIPINGLVWMGDRELMLQRVKRKIDEGFNCIKIKIGAINFEDELELLRFIRKKFKADEITIRLDANGAFSSQEALKILDRLSVFDIHSIEQPISTGDWKAMQKICDQSPIPVALDEELIGICDPQLKRQLLESIKPAYIILKPTLVGGLDQCKEWIRLASERGIEWWMTSALESNIGLNAIAQFTASHPVVLPHGLGTGQLFHNNIPSPLSIKEGTLGYEKDKDWDLSGLIQ